MVAHKKKSNKHEQHDRIVAAETSALTKSAQSNICAKYLQAYILNSSLQK